MNLVLAILCMLSIFVSSSWAEKANRAKRFAAFGSLSTVAGRLGCVVSQNKLFINGHYMKDLNEDEATELAEYKNALEKFKEEVKEYLEQRQAELQVATAEHSGAGLNIPTKQRQQHQRRLKKPEPPKKPSFCSDKATTQYVFDGCSVQGDNLYIGDSLVRKLSAEEQQELEQFDREFTAYQKAITADFRKKVESAFGEHFGSLFGVGGSVSMEQKNNQSELAASSGADNNNESSGVNGAIPKAPKTPNFCTLIV